VKGTIRFDNTDKIERLIGNMNGCIIPGRFDVGSKDGIWHFNEDSFKEDCVIIDKSQVKQVSLLDENQKPVVTVDMKTPCVGIWAPYGKHAPFVCIEPWYGIHDKVEYRGDFRQKYLMNHLQPGASFLSEYTITIK
jgi:galactose mutarotase-like enzyme